MDKLRCRGCWQVVTGPHKCQGPFGVKPSHVPSELSAGLDAPDLSEVERPTFEKALEDLINCYSMENESNTPDFLLAQYLMNCLRAFNEVTQQRETWYGRDARPVCDERI